MKIFVTGATGLVGANSALELLKAGHELTLLVRNKDVAERYFRDHGFDISKFVVADMLDKAAVKKGMAGCDAVLHSAAIVDLDARNAERTRKTNLDSIDAVIGSAVELGIEKILYVSSMSVFYDFSQPSFSEESPLSDVSGAYSLSKKLCEERVRELQAQGKPIITTYPVAVLGPNDPKLAESNSALVKFVNTVMPLTSSGYQFVDARDIAIIHRKLLESDIGEDKTQERYILGGHYLTWPQMADLLEQATRMAQSNSRKLRRIRIPGLVFRALGILFDWIRKLMPINFPISRESMCIVTLLPPASSERVIARTGIQFRPASESMTETVLWMHAQGHFD